MRMQYWNFFVEIKYKSLYYKYFQIYINRVNLFLTAFFSATSLSSVAAWGIWQKYPVLWSVIICVSQLMQGFFPKLPYNDLLIANNFMISALSDLLRKIERDWLLIEIGSLSDKKICTLLNQHREKYDDLVSQFFSGKYLPTIRWCEKKAQSENETYFSVTYSISIKEDNHAQQ